MIRALLLIFAPTATWEKIFRAQRSLLFVLFFYLVPLLVLTSAAEGYGMVQWGKYRGELARLKQFSAGETIIYEIAQLLFSLLIVGVGALLVKTIGETFHGRHTYRQAFVSVAYGLSPLFLLRLLDASNAISPWITWAVGLVLSIGVLYQGLPRIMQPDPPHAFGLYFMSSVLLSLITGLSRFITAWYLQGRFNKLEALISGLGARLPL